MKYKILLTIFGSLLTGPFAIAQQVPVPASDTSFTNIKTIDSLNRVSGQSFLLQEVAAPYGPKQPRALSTYSLSSVRSQEIRRVNTPNLANTLPGQLSGLYVAKTGSAPGNNDNPNLYVRGKQTFQDNSLLILVDGFETNWTNLIPDEIESVTVLKDAAALALYGMDGANGVVLISTKRGVATNKNIITFNSRFGIQSASVLPNFLGNGDYAELYNIAALSDGKSISSGYFKTQDIVDNFKNGSQPYLYPNVNWYDELLKPRTSSQDYSLTLRGGGESAKYFVALGYGNYGGLYKNTDNQNTNSNYNLKKYNLRTNADVSITSFLKAEMGLRGTMLNKAFPNASETTLWKTLALFNPYPVKTPNGAWAGAQGYAENPVAAVLQKGYQTINERTVDANVKLIGKLDFITRGLNVFGQLNFSNFYYSTYNKIRTLAYSELVARPDLMVPGGVLPFDAITRGTIDNNFSITQGAGNQWNRTTVIAGTDIDKKLGLHNLYASAMYLQEKYEAAGADMAFAQQRVMGRVSYNYDGKYLAEFGYAFSGSDNFIKGKRFGFFPSLSAGWLINKENFLKNNQQVNLLKLRASVGLLGNDKAGNTGRFIYNQFYIPGTTYNVGNALGIDERTYTEGNLSNPNATWEKALKTNVGIDALLFNKLSLAADYFYEYRTDIFLNPANIIPGIVGATYYNVNRGKVSNSGGEIELNFKDNFGDFGYNIGGNFSYARNKIINIQEPPRKDDYLNAKGHPINQPFILEATGFFKDQNDINQSPVQLFGQVKPGDVKYKDQNNDNIIDDNDRIATGKPVYPDFYYGINLGANLKGFDFNMFWQGAGARSISLLDNGNIIPFVNGGVKPTQWVKDNYWTPQRGDNAKFPRLTTENNDNNYRPSTLWQRSGAFIRLQTVELGYTLPQKLTQKWRINNVRFYASGNNLFTKDGINEINIDPEVNNMFVYPFMKSYNLGLSVQF